MHNCVNFIVISLLGPVIQVTGETSSTKTGMEVTLHDWNYLFFLKNLVFLSEWTLNSNCTRVVMFKNDDAIQCGFGLKTLKSML